MSKFKARLLSSLEEPCAQLTQRDLVEPNGLNNHQNENGNNETTQQIVPVAQPSVKLSLTNTLNEQKDEALKSNDSIDEAIPSLNTSKFSTSQLTIARTGPSNKTTGKKIIKLPTSQTYSRLNLGQKRGSSQKFTTSGYQLQSKQFKYPEVSPINRQMATLHQKATPSPSTKLNRAKGSFQEISAYKEDEQHFQPKFEVAETVGLDLSNKRSQSKVTKMSELTEMPEVPYQAWSSVPSLQSNFARTVTKSATVTSNEIIQLSSPWLPFPIYNYSQESYGIKSRELIHLPTADMESEFISNYTTNGSPIRNHLKENEYYDSNDELMSSPQTGNTVDSETNTLEREHEDENFSSLTTYRAEKNDSSENELKLVPYGAGHNYWNPTRKNVTKSTDLIRAAGGQEINSGLATSQFYSDKVETSVGSNEVIDQSRSWVPGFYRALPDFKSPEIIHSSKSGKKSTSTKNMSNGNGNHKLPQRNENTETGKKSTVSPQAKNMETMKSISSKEAIYSETEPETYIPLSASTCPQNNGTDGNISSNEHLQLVPYKTDHNYAQTQLNATKSTVSLPESETTELQSQVILSSTQFNSAQELSNGPAVEPIDIIHFPPSSQVTENNDQESVKKRTPDQQATNNETLEINFNNDSTWVEDDIEIASSQPFYFLPDTSDDISTEQLQSFPLQFFEMSPSNEIIISNELTYDPATSGTYSTSYIINGPAEQTKLKTSEADAAKPNGSKSIGLIQQTTTPKVSSQITLPSTQSNYTRAVLGDAIQSTSNVSSTKSTFGQKASSKFVIQSDVLIKPPKANVPAQSSKSKETTQNSKIRQGKPEVISNQVALQSKLKTPVKAKGNVRGHPYAGQNPAKSKVNGAIKLPTSSNTLLISKGSIKQPTSVVKAPLNLPLEDGTNFEVPQDYDVDRVMQKSKPKKVVQWDKLPQPLSKPATNSDPKKNPTKRKLKENIPPMTPSKKRRFIEDQVGFKIIRRSESSDSSFCLPEITVERIKMVGGVEQKVNVAGIKLRTPLEPISNKTLSDCTEILFKNNVSVSKIESKPVDKGLENYFKILEKNNVRVSKVKNK